MAPIGKLALAVFGISAIGIIAACSLGLGEGATTPGLVIEGPYRLVRSAAVPHGPDTLVAQNDLNRLRQQGYVVTFVSGDHHGTFFVMERKQ